jgi:hypothetical protein
VAGALPWVETMPPREALRRLICVAAIAVVVAAGFCLLDAHESTGVDLCSAALVMTAPLGAPLLPLVGTSVPVWLSARTVYPADLPAPPPRT